jgi:hypothetical protein
MRAALLAALVLAGTACGGSTTTTAAAPSARPSTHGVLTITNPRNGQVIPNGKVKLVVDLQGGRLSDTTSTQLVEDEGHLHVILDDELISMTSGLEQTLPDVAPGQHLLEVEFVANDHAPFDPRVFDAVAFEVKGP